MKSQAFNLLDFQADEAGDADMTAYLLLVGILVVMGGVLYAVTSGLADQDVKFESLAAVATIPSETSTQPQLSFTLIKGGPSAPYNLDLSAATNNDARIVIDGRQCSFVDGDFRVTGVDSLWHVGESIVFDVNGDCNGNDIDPYRIYSVTITLAGSIVYQDDVRARM